MQRAYIAGKISGLPLAEALLKFDKAAEDLRRKGFDPTHGFIINDVDINNHTKSWEECMKADIVAMLKCDCVWMLPCWDESKGASMERYIAHNVGLPVFYFEDVT